MREHFQNPSDAERLAAGLSSSTSPSVYSTRTSPGSSCAWPVSNRANGSGPSTGPPTFSVRFSAGVHSTGGLWPALQYDTPPPASISA